LPADKSSVHITAEQLLMVTGRLDDAPGFDTPRERFRRFLTEQVTDVRTARALVGTWQHSTGEQHRRALQDAVVMLGRFLRFETTFGGYDAGFDLVRYDGYWRSRRRLHVILELRSYETTKPNLDTLLRSLEALGDATHIEPEARRLALCIVTPLYAGRDALEDAVGDLPNSDVRILATNTLLSLAEMVEAGTLTHEEILKLLTSSSDLDFFVDLLERNAGTRPGDRFEEREAGTSYWLATIVDDETGSPEQVVQLLIGRRHILGVIDAPNAQNSPHPDDWICFLIPGTGIAGRGQVASIAEESTFTERDFGRFNRLIRLKNVELFDGPQQVPAEREQRFLSALGARVSTGPTLLPISRHEFAELTRADAQVSGRGSRSHESVRPVEPLSTRASRRTVDGGT